MFKKTLIASLLAVASLTSFASDFYVVVPVKGKTSSTAAVRVQLNTAQLPDAVVGVPYAGFDLKNALSVSGDAAYTGAGVTWSVVSSTLPAGLTLRTDGTISGTPTAAGTGSITARATYKGVNGQQTYQIVTLDITVGLATATLPSAKVGAAYAAYDFKNKLTVTGDPNYSVSGVTFSASGVPDGLTLSSAGILSGTPTTKSASGATFNVVASYKTKTGQQAYTIVVNGQYLDVTQITVGLYHTCVVTPSGGAQCWGGNSNGQLGNNSTVDSLVPVPVDGLTTGVARIEAGMNHTCAVVSSGGVKCWGRNTNGQLGNNSTAQSTVPVDVVGLTSGVLSISSGGYHTCAVTTSGGAKCWGANNVGQLGDNSTTQKLTPVNVYSLTSGVVSITGGDSHTCAVTSSGGAMCWGNNATGQVGNNGISVTGVKIPTAVTGLTSGVASISAGNGYTCAVTTAGGAKCWGYNYSGQLGNNSTTDSSVPVSVSGLTSGVAGIFGGIAHTCAVTTSGGVKCWGYNGEGELGNNSTTQSLVPVGVSGLSAGVLTLSTGSSYQNCAVTTSGGAKCWGSNTKGQLGNNSTTQSLVPVDVWNP